MPAPSLSWKVPADGTRGLVLLLHGGRPRSEQLVDGRSASWRRMLALQRAIAPRLDAAGVGSALLRYRQRGWNDGRAPVEDARWALDEVRREVGDLPVVLLGHSMGARTAVRVAHDEAVPGVVALAPWLAPDDPVGTLRGRDLVAAHGRLDRITSFGATTAYVERARGVARSVAFHDMGPVGHYLLRRVGAWNDLAAASVLALLDGGRQT